jgi:hypothetical protein
LNIPSAEELPNLCFSPDIGMIKSRSMSRACRTHGREQKSIQSFGGENLKERDHYEYLNVDERII